MGASLLRGGTTWTCHRYLFWDSVGRLVSKNYMHRLDVWGRAHGTRGGGHLLLEEWTGVQLPLYGDFFRCLRALGNPGVDMLTSIPDKVSPQTARLGGSAGALNGARRVIYDLGLPEEMRKTWIPHQPRYNPKSSDPFCLSGIVGPVYMRGIER